MTDVTKQLRSESVADTVALGERIGLLLEPGLCIGLIGALGAGKTQLVKGIARGAGVSDDVVVNSPTFVIVKEYPGRMRLCHIDVYRLSGADEFVDLGVDEMLASGAAVLIEWADRVLAELPPNRLTISIEHVGESSRIIDITGRGEIPERILRGLATPS